uniref:Ubiquitin-like domain-containing protein n=1 Tax=Toxoplasma gondii COUG TaxID=1074873 RepID=A0A2G8YDU1_TOXGO|nr:hypothetical protein TGCOUG_262160 [Toxoplasma gondii COUG]
MRLCIVNPEDSAGEAEDRGQYIEAHGDWTFSMLLRYLWENGIFSLPGKRQSGSQNGLADGLPSVMLTSNGVLFDMEKKIDDYALQPETKVYISTATYGMPTRLFVVLAETGETHGFEVFAADRVQVLMRLIRTRLGVEEDDMILVHRGSRLDPEKSLEDQCVGRDALVYLLRISEAPPLPPLPLPPTPAALPVKGKTPTSPRGKDARDAKKRPETKKGKKSK